MVRCVWRVCFEILTKLVDILAIYLSLKELNSKSSEETSLWWRVVVLKHMFYL